jgi:hypothetical protein
VASNRRVPDGGQLDVVRYPAELARLQEYHHTLTVALVKPARGSWLYQPMNSFNPKLYTHRVIGEEVPSSSKAFSRRLRPPDRLLVSRSSVSF